MSLRPAGTVVVVARQPADLPPQERPLVGVIDDSDDGDLLEWDDWLALLADGPMMDLPKRAAEYLHEAREAGEV
jgi:hypothetical protein